jgi:capsid protein
MPKDELQKEMEDSWRTYLQSLEQSLQSLESEIQQASDMTNICTDEWCEATEHYIDDIANALFSISEPRWANKADSDKIKDLKRRVYDMYANYREVYRKVG